MWRLELLDGVAIWKLTTEGKRENLVILRTVKARLLLAYLALYPQKAYLRASAALSLSEVVEQLLDPMPEVIPGSESC